MENSSKREVKDIFVPQSLGNSGKCAYEENYGEKKEAQNELFFKKPLPPLLTK